MNPCPLRTTPFVLLGVLLLACTLVAIAGCAQLRELDKRLWATPEDSVTSTAGPGDRPGAPDPDQVPPIIQTLAGILALGGYGGMAAWIRKGNRNGRANLDSLAARLDVLENTNHQ